MVNSYLGLFLFAFVTWHGGLGLTSGDTLLTLGLYLGAVDTSGCETKPSEDWDTFGLVNTHYQGRGGCLRRRVPSTWKRYQTGNYGKVNSTVFTLKSGKHQKAKAFEKQTENKNSRAEADLLGSGSWAAQPPGVADPVHSFFSANSELRSAASTLSDLRVTKKAFVVIEKLGTSLSKM